MFLAAFNSAAIKTATGIAIAPNADIFVRTEFDGAAAFIFSDETGLSLITQPGFQADASGRFTFYAKGVQRGYSIQVTSGAETFTMHNVSIGTGGQIDANFEGAVSMERARRRSRHFAALNYV